MLWGIPFRAGADLPPPPPRIFDPRWGHIEGTVVGQPDGKPRRLVTVTVTGLHFQDQVTTDDKGIYRFAPTAPGRYSLSVTSPYSTYKHPMEVAVTDQKTTTVAIAIDNEPAIAPPSPGRPSVSEMKKQWLPCALVQSMRLDKEMELYVSMRTPVQLHVGQEGVILTKNATDDEVRVDELFQIAKLFSTKQFSSRIKRERPAMGKDVICLLSPK